MLELGRQFCEGMIESLRELRERYKKEREERELSEPPMDIIEASKSLEVPRGKTLSLRVTEVFDKMHVQEKDISITTSDAMLMTETEADFGLFLENGCGESKNTHEHQIDMKEAAETGQLAVEGAIFHQAIELFDKLPEKEAPENKEKFVVKLIEEEIGDGGSEYIREGVSKAASDISRIIGPALMRKEATVQAAIDKVFPVIVNWKMTSKPTTKILFKKVEGYNRVIKIGKELKFSLFNVAENGIEQGNDYLQCDYHEGIATSTIDPGGNLVIRRLPKQNNASWRGCSYWKDKKLNSLSKDLSGGYYNTGNAIKFNCPQSFAMIRQGWSVIENSGRYETIGEQLALNEVGTRKGLVSLLINSLNQGGASLESLTAMSKGNTKVASKFRVLENGRAYDGISLNNKHGLLVHTLFDPGGNRVVEGYGEIQAKSVNESDSYYDARTWIWRLTGSSKKYEAAGEFNHVKDVIKWEAGYLLKNFNHTVDTIVQIVTRDGQGDTSRGTAGSKHYCWIRLEDTNYDRTITECHSCSDLAEMVVVLASEHILFKDNNGVLFQKLVGKAGKMEEYVEEKGGIEQIETKTSKPFANGSISEVSENTNTYLEATSINHFKKKYGDYEFNGIKEEQIAYSTGDGVSLNHRIEFLYISFDPGEGNLHFGLLRDTQLTQVLHMFDFKSVKKVGGNLKLNDNSVCKFSENVDWWVSRMTNVVDPDLYGMNSVQKLCESMISRQRVYEAIRGSREFDDVSRKSENGMVLQEKIIDAPQLERRYRASYLLYEFESGNRALQVADSIYILQHCDKATDPLIVMKTWNRLEGKDSESSGKCYFVTIRARCNNGHLREACDVLTIQRVNPDVSPSDIVYNNFLKACIQKHHFNDSNEFLQLVKHHVVSINAITYALL